jgi:hypothetical protein
MDLLRYGAFRWSTREEGDASALWWLAAAILAVILAWRIVKQRHAVRLGDGAIAAARAKRSGDDSEFYALERVLAAKTRPRASHEPLAVWFCDVEKNLEKEERKRAAALLELHHRYRFDPLGLGEGERAELARSAPKAT